MISQEHDIKISDIADLISQELSSHVIFQFEGEADALTAWIIGTYFIEQMDIFPFVLISSPAPQCGKSTALRMLSAFVKNARSASKITPAAIYRIIERDQPTLLLDEADRFVRNNPELIGILNAGHARFEAFVIINKKQSDGNWEPTDFPVWCAKAIAGIGDQDDTITGRSLVIRLRRKLASEEIKRASYNYPQLHQRTRELIQTWAEKTDLSKIEPLELLGKSDRATDNWIALGQIAKAIGKGWPDRVRKGFQAIELNRPRTANDIHVELISDLKEVLLNYSGTEIQSSELLNRILNKEDSDWIVHNHGRPVTQRWLAKVLSDYGVRSIKRSSYNVYDIGQLKSVFSRYLSN